MRTLRLLTMVWHSPYIDMAARILLPSILQPGNLPAIPNKLAHLFVTDEASKNEIEDRLVGPLQRALGKRYSHEYFLTSGRDMGGEGMRDCIGKCVADGAQMMLLPPDMFFANGSLGNLVRYVGERDFCVAGLHVRVDKEKFLLAYERLLAPRTISAPELVDLSFACAHPCLSQAFCDPGLKHDGSQQPDFSNCYVGGIYLQRLAPGLTSCIHRLPTTYLCTLVSHDADLFKKLNKCSWGRYDWRWPENLINEGRFKFLAASDLFFGVELTDAAVPGPPMERRPWNDEFMADTDSMTSKTRVHFRHNRMMIGLLRGCASRPG